MAWSITSLELKSQGLPCECGCGKFTTLSRGVPRRFVHGHNCGDRIKNWTQKHGSAFTGHKHTSESKKKMGDKIRGMFAGAKHPKWKGGITMQDKLERGKFKWYVQKLIFERDGYKCQLCDATGELQVDHIQSWAEFKELRFDPDNCRTLCAKCHYKLTFGREMPESIKSWGHNLVRRVIT